MSNYSESESMVRVSVFKGSGKWIEDIAVDMNNFYYDDSVHDSVQKAIEKTGKKIYKDQIYVCLEPHHKWAHPIILKERGVT